MAMRIAFPLLGGRDWLGGRNWLQNLFRVLACEAPGVVEALLLVEPGQDKQELASFASIGGVRLLTMASGGDNRLRAAQALLRPDPLLADVCRREAVDLLFEAGGFAGLRFPVPVLSWIPDFQHRHLPHYFSAGARAMRHGQMLARLRSARQFMLSSADAERDCLDFYPAARGRTHVVRFAVQAPAPVAESEWRETIARYGLPERYVFLPNQLWAHKNHGLVVDALSLAASGDAVVVATGADSDPRNPGYGARLRAQIAEAGVGRRFKLLGMVPYRDVGVLLAGAQALVNPSRFEGWSTTVEEAKASGVPLILSDLGVHREQAGSGAQYFGCDDPPTLAAALRTVEVVPPGLALARQSSVRHEQSLRLRDFAMAFIKVARASGTDS